MEDQRPKTLEHIAEVHKQINLVIEELIKRAQTHDASKLESPEREIFDEYTPKLKDTTYGSDEYKGYLTQMKVALDHHYKANMHHPEHFNEMSEMNLIDLIEMICDWYAATKRHIDGDIYKSIDINKKRFGISDQLTQILHNTISVLEKGGK